MNKIETVLVDAGKVVVYPFEHSAKVIALLGTALKDEPALKVAVTGLIAAAAKVLADGAVDVASKGANLPADISTVSDLQGFWQYFASTFLPAVESAIKDVKADLPATA